MSGAPAKALSQSVTPFGCVVCREVQKQVSALQAAQAELWAEQSQLTLEQQAIAEDKARAVQHAQEAANAHTKLLAQLKQARMQSLLVSVASGLQATAVTHATCLVRLCV